MSLSRYSKEQTLIQIIGLPDSGKKKFLSDVESNPLLMDIYRDHFKSNNIRKTLRPEQSLEHVMTLLFLKGIFMNDIFRKMVFCLDATQDLGMQFRQFEKILLQLQINNTPVEYFLYVSKTDIALEKNSEVMTLIESHLNHLDLLLMFPTKIFFSDPEQSVNQKMLCNFTMSIMNSFEKEFVYDKEKRQLDYITDASDAMIAPNIINFTYLSTEAQITIKHFHDEFDKLNSIYLEGISSKALHHHKDNINRFVIETLSQWKNLNLPYIAYTAIFARVSSSPVLSKHENPITDKLLGINILKTQKILLKHVRLEAMRVIKKQISQVHQAQDNGLYNMIFTEINIAKNTPLFASHRSNIINFFRPRQTDACNLLDKIAKDTKKIQAKNSKAKMSLIELK
jgi:hypothetical protein